MSQTADEVLEAALVLTAADRLRIADELFHSVDSSTAMDDFSDAQIAEFELRFERLRSGTVKGFTTEQVFERLDQAGRK